MPRRTIDGLVHVPFDIKHRPKTVNVLTQCDKVANREDVTFDPNFARCVVCVNTLWTKLNNAKKLLQDAKGQMPETERQRALYSIVRDIERWAPLHRELRLRALRRIFDDEPASNA